MNEREGVIKYRLEHHPCDLANETGIREINAWRGLLFKLGLIGQSPEKYQGLGYGNISQRLMPGEQAFLITGTQTGHLKQLEPAHFAVVETASPPDNTIISSGPCEPSSEALTHASVYLHEPDAQAVIHVHCPEIWRNSLALCLPHTRADIAYGSVEMALAVKKLFASGKLKDTPIFCMLGHEDGVVAFGASLREAAVTLLTLLASALAIEQSIGSG